MVWVEAVALLAKRQQRHQIARPRDTLRQYVTLNLGAEDRLLLRPQSRSLRYHYGPIRGKVNHVGAMLVRNRGLSLVLHSVVFLHALGDQCNEHAANCVSAW